MQTLRRRVLEGGAPAAAGGIVDAIMVRLAGAQAHALTGCAAARVQA